MRPISSPQTRDFFGIGRGSKTFRETEKFLFLPLFGFHTVFYEFQQHPVGAQAARLRHAANLCRHWCR